MPLQLQREIVLGHEISRKGIEVDKVKTNVIAMLSITKYVKDIRSFLGHSRFYHRFFLRKKSYRRFIKDFSKIARLLTNLLAKDVPFD